MGAINIIFYTAIFVGLYFSVFVLITFFENRKSLCKNPARKKKYPSICLIVPCYNEEKTVAKTVQSILSSNYPKDKLSVIVVDDGSEDQTYAIAKKYEKTGRVKVFTKENGGKYTAMNLGVKHAKAELIGSVDADSFLHPLAVKRIAEHFADPSTNAVIGSIKIDETRNPVEKIQFAEYLMANLIRKVFSVLNSINVTPGPLSVFRKEVFKRFGAYREGHQTEDLEFAFRLQSNNLKIDHAADAIVYTKACPNIRTLFRQRLRWRRGFIMNLLDYPNLLDFRRHGNLSLLLTYNILGSFFSIALLGFALWRLISFILTRFNYIALVGLNLQAKISFNLSSFLFGLGLNPITMLGFIATSVIIFYILMGKRLVFDKTPIWTDVIFYIIFYSLLNASWWVLAIYAIAAKRQVRWR